MSALEFAVHLDEYRSARQLHVVSVSLPISPHIHLSRSLRYHLLKLWVI